ncbi:LIM and senescent cell antigen-like-containing domain protein 1 [Sarcoptes scabiei]|uniref:LIM and senescent cell antigen-like-containing domain protein 1 n=2 Tax=Sarcoptes scabiei TaxID=52283 RepID=A0A834V8A4_SARSC|nr:LIM and senescent cell antigen-like-containing domain protein 1 [Sarcoptes scabiei]
MNANWCPNCFKCELCQDVLTDKGFFKNAGRALCQPCNEKEKAAAFGKYICFKCRAVIDDGLPLKFKNEAYHPYHFNCKNCGIELTSSAREIKGELYCLRCHDKMGIPICGACRRPIEERVVTALGKQWHVEHFVCAKCEKPFLGQKHYEKKGLAYCETHYHQLFGNNCFVCGNVIIGDTITALNKAWCPDHFACAYCDTRLTEKSKFYDVDLKPCLFSFVEIMESLELPAISFCTNNRLMLNKMKDFDQSFSIEWDELDDPGRADMIQTKVLKQILIDRTIRRMMDNLSIYEFSQLGNQWEDIIANQYFKCATDPFNLDKKCINHSNVIQSAQELGNCFTIFRRSENDVLKKIAIKSGISQSPVIRGVEDALNLEIADQPFRPNEIFRMMINFSIEERTTLNEKTMGHLIIHDENELPPMHHENFIIYPGYYYEFFISKETGKYLPSPYVTDCVDYQYKHWEHDPSNNLNDDYIQALSRKTCLMNCLAKHTINSCGCWPPELPFIITNSSIHYRWCSWRDGTNIKVNTSKDHNWFRYCFASHEKNCKLLCKTKCKSDSYEIMRQQNIWPSKERIDHSKKYNISYRKCCSLISILFWSSEQSIQEYQPKYEVNYNQFL